MMDDPHAGQHRLIDERVRTFRSTPRRSAVDRARRVALAIEARATLVGHLRSLHHESVNSRCTVEHLNQLHEGMHHHG